MFFRFVGKDIVRIFMFIDLEIVLYGVAIMGYVGLWDSLLLAFWGWSLVGCIWDEFRWIKVEVSI